MTNTIDFNKLRSLAYPINYWQFGKLKYGDKEENVILSNGVKYVAEQADAFWLIEKIVNLQIDSNLISVKNQYWDFVVKGDSGTLHAYNGSNPYLEQLRIPSNNFPEPGIGFVLQHAGTQCLITTIVEFNIMFPGSLLL